MLSAIAARKAARAAQEQATALPPQPTQVTVDSSSDSDDQLGKILPELAGEQVNENGTRTKRQKGKRKKQPRPERKRPRYFEPERRRDGGFEEETGVYSNPVNPVEPGARAWSPSCPLPASSDDDAEMEEQSGPATPKKAPLEEGSSGPSDVDSSPEGRPQSRSQPQRTPIPVYQLTPNVDIFYLDESETSELTSSSITGSMSDSLVALPVGNSVSIVGTFSLTLLHQTVSVHGVELSPSLKQYEIFGPSCSPLPVLTAIGSNSSLAGSISVPERLRHIFNKTDVAIFLISGLKTGVQDFGKACPVVQDAFDFLGSEDQLNISTAKVILRDIPTLQPYTMPTPWIGALESTMVPYGSQLPLDDAEVYSKPMVYLVEGPQRTGKSTFARLLLNRLLTRFPRVAFLDCDPGQPEFTPPGMVSLTVLDSQVFGPPFCHPRLPFRSHFIGCTSPLLSPSHYLGSLHDLFQNYQHDIQYSYSGGMDDDSGTELDGAVPLVVNTMGWIKGLGADLLRDIEGIVSPSHVFQFLDPTETQRMRPRDQQHVSEDSEETGQVTRIKVEAMLPGQLSARYTASDWRTISLLSYFYARFSETHVGGSNVTWDISSPLLARLPYCVSPSEAFDHVILIGHGSEDVVSSEIGRVLNGAVVALLSCDPGSVDPHHNSSPLRYRQGQKAPDPHSSNCLGMALIRSISPALISPQQASEQDKDNVHILHILTPIPCGLLSSARCIVKGEIELAVWGMLDFVDYKSSVVDKDTPYLQWNKGSGMGADRRRVRRNILRRGQF